MFTGLVETTAPVTHTHRAGGGMRLLLDGGRIASEASVGESICVSGCCLSVVAIEGSVLAFDLGPETLARTTLGRLGPGQLVNLERSLRLGDRLGGHLVSGHVDGIGHLESRQDEGDWAMLRFSAEGFTGQMVPKGSIAVDGVSLTVCQVESSGFSVQLIPHTLAVTTTATMRINDPVNLETDMIGKLVGRQVEQWLEARGSR
ncbi:MAG: riboflavin synthase [Planctomycetaceae bacterium]